MTRTNGTTFLIIATFALALLTVAFGATGYSLHGFLDSMGLMPPAVSVAIGQGFKNHVTDLRDSWGDPTGRERYLWFPPLYSLVVSAFILPSIPLPPPQQALLGTGILAAIAVVLASLVFYNVATLHGRRLDIFGAILIVAMLVIMLRSMWTMMARPEVLESVLLLAGFLLALNVRRLQTLVVGFAVILGLMAATHPFGTLFFAAFAGLFFSFRFAWRQSIAYLAATCLLGAVAFVLVMQLSPYGIRETYTGIYRHTSLEVARVGGSTGSALGILKSPYVILYAIFMLFVAIFCIDFYRRYRSKIRTPILFGLCVLSIGVLMFYLVVLGAKTYYALLFSLLVFAVMTYYLVHVVRMRFVKFLALPFIVLFGAFSLKPVLAFPAYLRNGVSIAEARELFAPIALRYPAADIFISADMWTVAEEYVRMHYVADITPEQKTKRPYVVLIDQNHSYGNWNPTVAPPAEAEGCPLVEDYFVKKTPKFFGFAPSNVMPGYGFAVYVCE